MSYEKSRLNYDRVRKFFSVLAVFLLILTIIPAINNNFFTSNLSTVKAAIYYVDSSGGGKNSTTIQDAINAASNGDTIIINESALNENVIVNKSVTLTNGSGITPVIDGMGGYGFNVTVNNVTIQNMTVENCTSGIGIYVHNSSNPSDVLQGIILDNLTVNNSQIGIAFDNATGCNVTYCNIENSSLCGILLGMKQWLYSNFSHCSDFNISNCVISQTVHVQSGPGIKIYNSTHCTISNNTVYNMSYDAAGPYSPGVELVYADFNILSDNNISSCDSSGIGISFSDNNTISSNEVYNNTDYDPNRPEESWGILLQGSCNNSVTGNNITSSEHGINLTVWQGYYSENNTLYYNNIYGNIIRNGFDNCSNNNWNSSTHGNYWDNYDWYTEGAWDNDSNAIIDDPYTLPGGIGATDNYPLRCKWNGTSLPTGTASIYGYVINISNSSGIGSATVEIYHNQTNVYRNNLTNGTGFYNFTDLAPNPDHDYYLKCYKPGIFSSNWISLNVPGNAPNPDINFTIDLSGDPGGPENFFLSDFQSSVSPSYIMNNTIQKFNFSIVRECGSNLRLDNLTINFPTTFTYIGDNGTSLGNIDNYTVKNTSNSVSWLESTGNGFIFNSTEYFWFNASSNATLGSGTFNISAINHNGGGQQNISITAFTTVNFSFAGSIHNKNGQNISGAVAEITVSSMGGDGPPTSLGTFNDTTDAEGRFNITNIPICQNFSTIDCSQVSCGPGSGGTLFYQLAAYEYNDSTNTYAINTSRTLPSLPATELKCMLNNPEFYLIPAISFNVTAIGPDYNYENFPPELTGYSSKNFEIMVKDQALGYSVKEFSTQASQRIFSVPAGRNYTLSIYPSMSFPMSIRFNNISWYCENQAGDFDIDGVTTSSETYNGTYLVNVEINTTSTAKNLTGNFTGITTPDSMRIVAYNMETQNMVFEEWALPFNLGYDEGWTKYNDTYNLTACNYSIALPATTAPSYLMLRAYAHNNSGYYMSSNIINASNGNLNVSNLNFTMEKLITGTNKSISSNNVSNTWSSERIVNTTSVLFRLVNATGSHLSSQTAFVEVKRELDGTEYMTMIDGENGVFNLSLVEGSSIKKLTIYSQQYASISAPVSAAVLSGSTNNSFFNCTNGVCNITMRSFGEFDPLGENSSLTMDMFLSNSSCNIPNPPSSYSLIGSQGEDDFSPLNAILKGDVSLMISTNNVSVYYINVDLLASGPPDAAFTDSGSESGFASLWKFGSQGPEIYESVIIGVNYSGQAFENEDVIRLDIPLLFDNEFNEIWNRSKGHGITEIQTWDNLSDYRDYLNTPYEAYLNGTGVTCSESDSTLENNLAYRDITNTTIWMKIPHFSGTGFEFQADYTPSAPSSFSATKGGTDSVSLTWTKGNKADKTRIQRKTGGYPSSISDGTNVYNNTGSSYTDSSLSAGTKYYYRAWSYNSTGNDWSSSYASDTATTDSSTSNNNNNVNQDDTDDTDDTDETDTTDTTDSAKDDVETLFSITLTDNFTATDSDGNGEYETDEFNDPNGQLTATRSVNLSGTSNLLISVEGSNDLLLWDPSSNTTNKVTQDTGTITKTEADTTNESITITVQVNKTDWIYIEVTDQYPDIANLTVKRSDGTTVPTSQIWRENGKIYVLDDPDTNYTFEYNYTILAPTFSPESGTTFTNAQPTITITYNETVNITQVTLAGDTITLTTDDNKTYTFTSTDNLSNGEYTLSISVEDIDSNTRIDTATYNINVPSAKPTPKDEENQIMTIVLIVLAIILLIIVIIALLFKTGYLYIEEDGKKAKKKKKKKK